MNRVRSLARLFESVFDDIYYPEVTSWTLRGKWVDADKYEVVPKESYKKELIRQKEEEIDNLDAYYQNRRKELTEEKERLLGKNKDG